MQLLYKFYSNIARFVQDLIFQNNM